MNTVSKYMTALALALAAAMPVMAASDQHPACDSNTTIDVGDMGAVNEETLQRRIEDTKAELRRVSMVRGAQTLRLSHKRALRGHLEQMQVAMDKLHTVMYNNGCEAALHGMSVEARLEALEKRASAKQ